MLLSVCQASHFEEDAMSDGRPASHAPVGLNEHYIKLNFTEPEGPAWPCDLQISAVETETDLALRSQIIEDAKGWKEILNKNVILIHPGFE